MQNTQIERNPTDTFGSVLEAAKARHAERLAKIICDCPEHGKITQAEADESGWHYGGCPKCYEIERAKKAAKERAAKVEQHIVNQIPKRFLECSFDSFIAPTPNAKKNLSVMRLYADSFEKHIETGTSLVLCGGTGTGKTHLACALIAHIARNFHKKGVYTTAYHIVREIKACYGKKDRDERSETNNFIAPSLLVVDEVGVQFGTDTEKLLLFEVLNGRYEAMKPSVVISNLNQKEISDYLGDRVMDRLKENGGAALVFDWGSKR